MSIRTSSCYVTTSDGQLIVKIKIVSMFSIAIIISSSFFCCSIIKNCNNHV